MNGQHYTKIKDIYNFTNGYMLSRFPKLPACRQFNARLNRLAAAWQKIAVTLISIFIPKDCNLNISTVDSFPVITRQGRNRHAKAARDTVDKGYCSTEDLHYYGLKLHSIGFKRQGTVPFPEMPALSQASANDYRIFAREFDPYICNRTVFADKIYHDREFFNTKEQTQNCQILTPVKLVKGEPQMLREREKAANDLFSNAVSTVRQPIESLFNRPNEKTNIQMAAKVCSTAGLPVHVFIKIAAAFIYLIF